MKLHRARPICRAPNRFSASLALYQHFVVPYNLRQQRLSSTASEPKSTEGETSSRPVSITLDTPARAKLKLTYVDQKAHEEIKRGAKAPSGNPRTKYQAHQELKFQEEILLISRLAVDDGKEYTGLVVRPTVAQEFVPEHMYPWASATSTGRKSEVMGRLNKEIHDFYEYAKPNRAEALARKNLVEQVRGDVRGRFPDHVLEVFGSERTGMAFATSDIDLRMIRREQIDQTNVLPPAPTERRDLLQDLFDLRFKIFGGRKKTAQKYLNPVVRRARYPLLSLLDRGSGLDVQIVLSNNTAKSREFVARYMKEYPYIRQVYAVVKTMFDQRGLSDVYRGGFGSYPIFMMIVASLQNQANQRGDAAGALINFLYYWAYFKTKEHGVSVSPPEYFDKKEHPVLTDSARAKIESGGKRLPDWMLCLRDPADETNDLGRKGSSILHVQATLRQLTTQIINDLNKNQRHSLLASLVGEVYARDRDRREKLERHGTWIKDQVQISLAAAAQEMEIKQEGQDEVASSQGEETQPESSQAEALLIKELQAEETQPESSQTEESQQEDAAEDVHSFLGADEEPTTSTPPPPFESAGDGIASTFGMTEALVPPPTQPEPPSSNPKIRYHKNLPELTPFRKSPRDSVPNPSPSDHDLAKLQKQIGQLHVPPPAGNEQKAKGRKQKKRVEIPGVKIEYEDPDMLPTLVRKVGPNSDRITPHSPVEKRYVFDIESTKERNQE